MERQLGSSAAKGGGGGVGAVLMGSTTAGWGVVDGDGRGGCWSELEAELLGWCLRRLLAVGDEQGRRRGGLAGSRREEGGGGGRWLSAARSEGSGVGAARARVAAGGERRRRAALAELRGARAWAQREGGSEAKRRGERERRGEK
ncbi:heterogeneous nuclear ribonucleoprotein A1-like [Asparagus officinalis]|uniref:heterogeneous nuclear ribonucleoprotein A1-like n=1 Tax=Asparagus officinalis TaxID=4686 RepID=UPI00098E6D2D|nr:heterogeneous nuclear ribonucleoprotein A1-like [Asparagus officinalis]